jgi:hypothetical protein
MRRRVSKKQDWSRPSESGSGDAYVQVIPRGDAHLMALDRLTLTLLHPCIVVYLHPPNLRLPKVLLEARVEVAPPLKKHCFADELEPRCKLE